MKIRILYFFFVIFWITACSKSELDEKDEICQQVMGRYQIVQIHKVDYDSLGKVIKDTTINNPGECEFLYTNAKYADQLNKFITNSSIFDQSDIFNYFIHRGAYTQTVDNKRYIFWDVDYNQKCLVFFCNNRSSWYHTVVNIDGTEDLKLIFAIKPSEQSKPEHVSYKGKEEIRLRKM